MRTRTIDAKLYFTEEEMALIKDKMNACGERNRSRFLRKLIFDGKAVYLDTKPVAEYVRLVRNIANNVNQIAKRVNETSQIYAFEVKELAELCDDLKIKVNVTSEKLNKFRL